MIDPVIFEDLQAKIDEDTVVRDVRAPLILGFRPSAAARDRILTP